MCESIVAEFLGIDFGDKRLSDRAVKLLGRLATDPAAQRHATPAKLIIRAKINRSLPERDLDAGPHAYRKVRDDVASSPAIVVRTVELPRTPKREARPAKIEVRAKQVRVKPPHVRRGLPETTYRVVPATEAPSIGC